MAVVVVVVEEVWGCGCTGRLKGTDTELVRGGKVRQTARKKGSAYLKRLCL